MNFVRVQKSMISSEVSSSLAKATSPPGFCPTLSNNVLKPIRPQLNFKCSAAVQSVLHYPKRAGLLRHMSLARRGRSIGNPRSKSTHAVTSPTADDSDKLLAVSRNLAFVGLLCTAIAVSILKFFEVRLMCVCHL